MKICPFLYIFAAMDYRTYINTICARFGLKQTEIDVIMLNQSVLIPDADAEVDATTAKRALVSEFANLIPLANVSEGGMSITWNIDAMKLWYAQTCKELGLLDEISQPTITDRSNIW